ncbi:restriction endonuclease subunit S [Cellulophaga baltica]|uniref:restriction endonuclease subunit S n=1 Tax=Cellulophaga baltica TaxID=76594 RepID=UPI0037C8473E
MEKELPKNWVETDLMNLCEVYTGKKDANFATENGEYNFFTCAYKPLKSDSYSFEGDVLILPGNGVNVGEVFYFSGKFEAYQRTYIVNDIKIDPKYLFYHFSRFWREIGSLKQFGSATNYIKIGNFKDYKVQFPPLAEQQRIVAKLDELFWHLDSLKTRLNHIPQILKNFRQAVLTQAVTGKLTEEWRGTKSVKVDSPITIGDEFQEKPKKWIWNNLIDLAKLESGHTPRKSKEEYWIDGDVPWISLQDIRAAHGTIITDTKFKPNMVGINNSSARLLPKGTVCFSRDISVGYTTIMGKEMATTQHFANWICGEKLYNKYLLFAFISAKDFLIASGKGTTVKTIYMPALKQFRILLPPKEEQTEIVKRVEQLLAKADAIETQYQSLNTKIDSLPQAILAKAFKGELVEQLETDGSAVVLLEEIKALRESVSKKAVKTRKKKKK